MKLTAKQRARLVAELQARERFSTKALCRRHKISRQTVTRLRAELIEKGALKSMSQFDSIPAPACATPVASVFFKSEIEVVPMADELLDAVKKLCDGVMTRMDSTDLRLAAMEEREKMRDDGASEKIRADAAAAAATRGPDPLSTEGRAIFGSAQMRFDSAYQALGTSAPGPLSGEELRNYRIRLATGIKANSRDYRDSDLSTIGDETAFTLIEGRIIADAVAASTSNATPEGQLRMVTSIDEHGRRVAKFYGDAETCWAPFMGGATRLMRLVRNPDRQ
jgi:hypothetical protein